MGKTNTFEETAVIKPCAIMGHGNYVDELSVIGCNPVHVPLDGRATLKGVVIGDDNYFYASSHVVRGVEEDTTIKNTCIFGQFTLVGHDSHIGCRVRVMNHVTINGHVDVGDDTFIGAASTIRNRIRVGRNCYIGQGSNVVKDMPDNSFGYGNPLRVVRANDPAYIDLLKRVRGAIL